MGAFQPLVVDVKRHSTEDGPGIRSVVFFKGCPLRCSFCANPEAQNPRVEIAFYLDRCNGSALCAAVCPYDAIELEGSERIRRDLCQRCGACTEVCPTGALQLIGKAYSPQELAEYLLRDRRYYEYSNGGVTLSGGEPTMYSDYVEQVLKLLKAENLHVILETGGHFGYESFRRKILPYVDLVYFSLKIADPDLHKLHTGKSNTRIIENLNRLMKEPRVQVEGWIPIIPGITDTRENLESLVGILRAAGVKTVKLLPYNPLGTSMEEALGRTRCAVPVTFMHPNELGRVHAMFSEIVTLTQTAATGEKTGP
jgi:pyruvate formate lyase activating enzyme